MLNSESPVTMSSPSCDGVTLPADCGELAVALPPPFSWSSGEVMSQAEKAAKAPAMYCPLTPALFVIVNVCPLPTVAFFAYQNRERGPPEIECAVHPIQVLPLLSVITSSPTVAT